jgi:diadenosine tetraphosphatase ApaH/serine/threonine PP2A family protein phosphatase
LISVSAGLADRGSLTNNTVMRIALLSDIHANLQAFLACLSSAQTKGAERFVLLGDFVGYGPEPEACVSKVRELVSSGALAIKGNHDHAAIEGGVSMNDLARTAIDWTRDQLSSDSLTFLSGLPLALADRDRLYVHADPSAPQRWNYVLGPEDARIGLLATDSRITFCGHVHVPALYGLSTAGKVIAHRPVTDVAIPLSTQFRWLAVVGAVGQPRDGNPAASFALYDTDSRELTYCRVPYDVEEVAAQIRAAGLPERLALRLLLGR